MVKDMVKAESEEMAGADETAGAGKLLIARGTRTLVQPIRQQWQKQTSKGNNNNNRQKQDLQMVAFIVGAIIILRIAPS